MTYLQLKSELTGKGFNLSDARIKALHAYIELLLKWNRVMNLVGRSDAKFILNSLILDSFYLGSFLSRVLEENNRKTTLDLGAGAGLPGIPLRLIWSHGIYYLVESRIKRAAFMNQAIAAMNLENTFVINARVQDIDPGVLPAGLIISRAFMPCPELLPLANEMLKKKGMLIILSGKKFEGQNLPGFRMVESMEYRVNGKKRYFWALESNI